MEAHISDVIHKTYMKMYEEGTEAAAVTGIMVECKLGELDLHIVGPCPGGQELVNVQQAQIHRPLLPGKEADELVPVLVGSQAAADSINGWGKEKTCGKIDSIVSVDSLTEDTLGILINALYFNGKWAEPMNSYPSS